MQHCRGRGQGLAPAQWAPPGRAVGGTQTAGLRLRRSSLGGAQAKMAAERQDALREFVAVTGTEEDRARFFLESAGWDLQVARRGGRWRGVPGIPGLCGAGQIRPLGPKRTVIPSQPARPRPGPGLGTPGAPQGPWGGIGSDGGTAGDPLARGHYRLGQARDPPFALGSR